MFKSLTARALVISVLCFFSAKERARVDVLKSQT